MAKKCADEINIVLP